MEKYLILYVEVKMINKCCYCNKETNYFVFSKLCLDCYGKIVWPGWRYKFKEIFSIREKFLIHISNLKKILKI